MKGKILAGIVLWCIGAIYAFLIYPLLQKANSNDYPPEQSSLPCLVGAWDWSFAQSQTDDCVNTQENNTWSVSIPAISQWESVEPKICFQSTCFTIEIADTFASRQQGLMNRPSLPQDAGMLFVFDTPGSYGFWMKNTLIPLDIIWMDEDFVVVDTATMEPCIADPCSTYNHSGVAMYALEINAWLVDTYAIKQGDIFIQK